MLAAARYYIMSVLIMLILLCLWTLGQAATVTLAWDNVTPTNAVLTRLYQMQGTDCTNPSAFAKAGEVPFPGMTVVVSNLTEGLPYCWHVKAVNATGVESDPSNTVVYTVPVSAPPAPRNLRRQ